MGDAATETGWPVWRFGGYAAWEFQRLSPPPDGTDWWVMALVRFRPENPDADPKYGSLGIFLDSVGLLPPGGVSHLENEIKITIPAEKVPRGTAGKIALHVWLHVRVGALTRPPIQAYLPHIGVLHVGPPMALSMASFEAEPSPARSDAEPSDDPPQGGAAQTPPTPWIGIIDDGIPFLNSRFLTPEGKTRFKRVWLQALQEPETRRDGLPLGDTAGKRNRTERSYTGGMIVSEAEINTHLARGDEARSYSEFNAVIYRNSLGRRVTNRARCHGDMVLDLATGADPSGGDRMQDVPILAVQVPPEAVEDGSSRRIESNILLGLHWILSRAAQETTPPPLIINISLGGLAGSKDRRGFMEQMINAMVTRYRDGYSSTNADGTRRDVPGAPIRIVFAFGNAWRSRQVAAERLGPCQTLTLDWRAPPDDRTSSFIELRARPVRTLKDDEPSGDPDVDDAIILGNWSKTALEIGLCGPDGNALPLAALPKPGTARFLGLPGETPRAAIWGDHPRRADPDIGVDRRPFALIAIAPTAGFARTKWAEYPERNAFAPAGRWTVTVTNTGTQPVNVALQIQRDDTPDGHRKAGRQSRFDHPKGRVWDAEMRNWNDPGNSPITRQGTHVGHGGLSRGPEVYFAGAAYRQKDDTGAAPIRATRYTSEGAGARASVFNPGQVRPAAEDTSWRTSPTLAAIVEEGFALRGQRAAGTRSGSVARLSGTSAAAPLLARALLRLALIGQLERKPLKELARLAVSFGGRYPSDSRLGRVWIAREKLDPKR